MSSIQSNITIIIEGSRTSLIGEDQLADRSDRSVYDSKYNEPIIPLPSYNTSAQQQYSLPPRESPRDHVAISMEAEPRRPGRRGMFTSI